MERFDRLFRDAERLKPTAAMWRNIAAKAGMPGSSGRGGSMSGDEAGMGRKSLGWRLAASLAIGLGVLSALFMVMGGPRTLAGDPGGAGDSAVTAAAAGQGREDEALLDPEVLDWHADLGEEPAAEWESDPLWADPMTEAADAPEE